MQKNLPYGPLASLSPEGSEGARTEDAGTVLRKSSELYLSWLTLTLTLTLTHPSCSEVWPDRGGRGLGVQAAGPTCRRS